MLNFCNFEQFAFYEHFTSKNANCLKLQKLRKFQIALRFDLLMLYWCHRYENTSKESQEHIFDNISSVRPLPADPGHESDWQNQENHQKIAKNAIFQKSIFCSIVAGNMIFGRKLVL